VCTSLTVTQLGPGRIAPLQAIPSNLLGHKLVWSPPPSATTDATISTFIDDLMNRVTAGVSGTVQRVTDSAAIETACPENFNLLSNCLAAVDFGSVDIGGHGLVGLYHADVDETYLDRRTTHCGVTLGWRWWMWIIMRMTMYRHDFCHFSGQLKVSARSASLVKQS
jgi:hypothetical protein